MESMKNSQPEENDNQLPKRKPRVVKNAPSGMLRDKARSKARLVAAVGKVLQKSGYAGLTAPNVATAAGLDKKLVWTYFGGLDNLVEEYIRQRDFWKQAAKGYIDDLMKHPEKVNKDDIAGLLKNQFDTVLKDKVLQKIIHWELGEKNKMLRKVADKREEIGEELFQAILPDFEKSNINIRPRLALLIGGIYYLSLHAKSNGSTFCGVDINTQEGKEQVDNAIQEFIFETYERLK